MFKLLKRFLRNQMLVSKAWDDHKAKRYLDAERKLVTVALARLRTDFELNAAQIKRELAAQTPDGIFKKDEHKISQNLRGVVRGTLRTHIIKMGKPLELYDNDEALALTKSAEKIGLKASFSYNTGHDRSIHHPDNATTSSELDAMSAGGRIFLTLTRL